MKKKLLNLIIIFLTFSLIFTSIIQAQPQAFIEPFNTVNPTIWNTFGNGTITTTGGILTLINGTNTADGSANSTGLISKKVFAIGNFIYRVECVKGLSAWGLINQTNKNIAIAFVNMPDGSIRSYVNDGTHIFDQVLILSPLSGFNEYRIEWTLDYIRFYINGLMIAQTNIVPLTNLNILAVAIDGMVRLDYISVGSWLSEYTTSLTTTVYTTNMISTTLTSTNTITRSVTVTATYTYVVSTISQNTTIYSYTYLPTTVIQPLTYYTTVVTSTQFNVETEQTTMTVTIPYALTFYNTTTAWRTSLQYVVSTRFYFMNYTITHSQYGAILAGMAFIGVGIGAAGYYLLGSRLKPPLTKEKEKKPPAPILIEGVEKLEVKPPEPSTPAPTETKEERRKKLRERINNLIKRFGGEEKSEAS